MGEKFVYYLETDHSYFSIYLRTFCPFCSSAEQNYRVESKYVLDVVRGKLLNSVNALEHEAYSGDIILQSAKQPLSLNAVAEGPKLRLLWAAFQQVEEEAGNPPSFLYCHMNMLYYFGIIQNFDNLKCNKCLKYVFWLNISWMSYLEQKRQRV